jgi:hypothetical protein
MGIMLIAPLLMVSTALHGQRVIWHDGAYRASQTGYDESITLLLEGDDAAERSQQLNRGFRAVPEVSLSPLVRIGRRRVMSGSPLQRAARPGKMMQRSNPRQPGEAAGDPDSSPSVYGKLARVGKRGPRGDRSRLDGSSSDYSTASRSTLFQYRSLHRAHLACAVQIHSTRRPSIRSRSAARLARLRRTSAVKMRMDGPAPKG